MFGLERSDYVYLEEINQGILRQLGRATASRPKVLDVGCGRAGLGEALRARGYEVWGIESAPTAAETATQRLDKLLPLDLCDYARIEKEIGPTRFDYLIFADVLEHVPDPVAVLRRYLAFLKPGGQVLVSVPNSMVWFHRLEYLLGRFEYRESGVLDRTHLRFFTFRSTRRLARTVGLTIRKVDTTPYLVRALLPLIKRVMPAAKGSSPDPAGLLRSRPYRWYLKWVYPVENSLARCFKGLLGFQIILVGEK